MSHKLRAWFETKALYMAADRVNTWVTRQFR